MNMRIDREIDDDLIGLDSGLFDRLPPVGRATLPSSRPDAPDYDVMGLHTTLFDTLPPVANVSLDPMAPPAADARLDTLAPPVADLGVDPLTPATPAPSDSTRTNTSAEVIAGAALIGMILGAGLFWLSGGLTTASPSVALAAAGAPAAVAPPAPLPEAARQVLPAAEPTPTPPLATAAQPTPPVAHKPRASTTSAPVAAEPPPADLPAVAPTPEQAAEAPPVALPPLDEAAAAAAIADAAKRATNCLEEGDGRRTMPVSVTFAPSGRATQVLLRGGPLLGTEEGACIARALRSATVGAFDGMHTKVSATVHVP